MGTNLLWDFIIHTDRVIKVRRPDIVIVEGYNTETIIVDIIDSGD